MTPKHIGIIMDGNRRWARKRGLSPWEGHWAGYRRSKEIMKWCRELGIKELTLYTFSTKNFDRPAREVREIFRIVVEATKQFLKDPDVRKYRVRVRAIGRIHLFPKYVQVALAKVMDATKDYDRYFINLALGYGGREEITDAVRAIAEDVKKGKLDPKKINEGTIQQRLYLSSEPELIIRTSGEQRTSDFLPWQGAYAEWYFTPKPFPDFSRADLVAAIKDYESRERRYGK
jgi:tritrans,polycis-undecaprenyl-diphosphate synthase [geranylgeranyl-diphosphate specific]